MNSTTHWKQKRSIYKTTFEFAEEELTYTFDNCRTKVGGTVAYHKIPARTSYREVKLWWMRYFFVFYVVMCLITGFHYGSLEGAEAIEIVGLLAAPALAIFLMIVLLRKPTGLTSIPLNPVLFIIHDPNYKTILEGIMKRRMDAMRKKLAQVDFDKPYYEEVRKFGWLKAEGVIDEQEYRHARQKISAMRDKAGLLPPMPSSVN